MEFRLLYEGPLKTNRGPLDKQSLRREFHGQLKELLTRPPMQPVARLVEAKHPRATIVEIGRFTFVPLISEKFAHVARLEITLLSREEPGRVITQGGDLDNRLKTLLDALLMPKNKGEIPSNDSPEDGETPFYCLLEDDSLISGITVVADRLLRKGKGKSDVVLVIRVIPESTGSTLGEVRWSRI